MKNDAATLEFTLHHVVKVEVDEIKRRDDFATQRIWIETAGPSRANFSLLLFTTGDNTGTGLLQIGEENGN